MASSKLWRLFLLFALVLAAGCRSESSARSEREETAAPSQPAPVERPQADEGDRPRIVILGDSLTAGLGLPREQAYPTLLQQYVDKEGMDYDVVNAGVSGDTSAGGLRRLDWALDGDVRVLVLALGANDGLRGISPQEMQRNLTAIIEKARERNIDVVLAGMEAPPNLGPEYTKEFRAVYQDLARQYKLPTIPFLLYGVAGVASMNQRDGIHPNAEGAKVVADLVWSVLQPVAEKRAADASARP